MGPLLHALGEAYRTSNEEEINRILSVPKNVNDIKDWLSDSYSVQQSVMLQDLKERIEHLDRNAPSTRTASDLFNRVIRGEPSDVLNPQEIESRILSGKIEELTEYFRSRPQELMKHENLIDTHILFETINLHETQGKRLLLLLLDTQGFGCYHSFEEFNDQEGKDFQGFTNTQLLQLCCLFEKSKTNNATFPSFAQNYIEILRLPKNQQEAGSPNNIHDAVSKIKALDMLTDKEKMTAIAYYIEKHCIPLAYIYPELTDQEFLDLACDLHYINLREFSNISLAKEFLGKIRGSYKLLIKDKRILDGIEELPFCKEFFCNFSDVTSVPKLPRCEKFISEKAPSLTEIPDLPNCREVYCSNCPSLHTIGLLPSCLEFKCLKCESLPSLPDLPLGEDIDCSGCTSLYRIPALPACEYLNFRDCPNVVEYPEVPWNAHVSCSMDFSKLEIETDDFSSNPYKLLSQLGRFLLNGKPFPNVYYFEKGELNEAMDIGGVRRDFISRLCLSLFKPSHEQPKQGKFLIIEDGLPVATDRDETAYRTIGHILALSYPESSYFKTGPLFDEKVYGCMLNKNALGSDEWLLSNYLNISGVPEVTKQIVDLDQDTPTLSSNDLMSLAYLIEPDADGVSKYTQSFFSDDTNRFALGATLIARAKEDPKLKAILWMTEELKRKIPRLADNTQERVEGVLNTQAIIDSLVWKFTSTVTDHQKIKDYLTTWIEKNPDKHELFVRAVTGNRTLCSKKLKIEVFDRDKTFIPVSHTCFFSLELSGNYENQDMFDQRIKFFLEHALAGSGFSSY